MRASWIKAYCSYTAKVQAVLASTIVDGVIHSANVMKIVRGTHGYEFIVVHLSGGILHKECRTKKVEHCPNQHAS